MTVYTVYLKFNPEPEDMEAALSAAPEDMKRRNLLEGYYYSELGVVRSEATGEHEQDPDGWHEVQWERDDDNG